MRTRALLGGAPASAVTYRYWTYWWGDDTGGTHTGWKFASVGPASQTVGDRAVIGWRFATTSAAGTTKPRYSSAFDQVCPNADPPPSGEVRVAVVVDFGSSSDWPPGDTPPVTGKVYTACVTVPTGSRATTAMTAAHLELRTDSSGLICGVDGFPATECAPIVSGPTASPSPTRTSTRTPSPTATSRPSTSTARTASSAASTTTSAAVPLTGASSSPAAASAAPPTASSDPSGSALPADEAALPATTTVPVAAAAPAGSSSTPWGAAIGVVVVGLLAGSAWWTSTRRRGSS